MAHDHALESPTHGIVAEFLDADALIAAAKKARGQGYTKVEAYSPFPIHDLDDAIGFFDPRIKWIIFFCGLAGAAAGMGLQYYTSVIDYPWNVGGRPLFSWPSFIPVTFECTILFSAFGAFIGMLALNGLPKPYHPIFNTPNFEKASQDRFFLCIEAEDPKFDEAETTQFMTSLGAEAVSEVKE